MTKPQRKIIFEGSCNRIRCQEYDGSIILSWRHGGRQVKRTCTDRHEAFNIVRATFPAAVITYRD